MARKYRKYPAIISGDWQECDECRKSIPLDTETAWLTWECDILCDDCLKTAKERWKAMFN